ncbi:conserved hypothetical protein [uncultured Desulfobacterium sp.]|uniref:Uncharacterized protein n=1 Tax=uncultured Desulfobacterium sp. TaxID=201089 RepID=A0A445MQV5_9BACT|nr:conserved hypothetical protein [uncultured Desulfobacterium sp.]
MLIYDGVYHWKGWGGKLRLASGTCRLRIFDQKEKASNSLVLLRPIVVIVSDLPGNTVSIRSCAGHLATTVTRQFNIIHQRMLWVEFYPSVIYGADPIRIMPERYESVEFRWKQDLAIDPKWRPLKPPLLDAVKQLMENSPNEKEQ